VEEKVRVAAEKGAAVAAMEGEAKVVGVETEKVVEVMVAAAATATAAEARAEAGVARGVGEEGRAARAAEEMAAAAG
jgi:hypothetical protein